MVTGTGEPRGDEESAELVAVQANLQGLVIQAEPAHMSRRGPFDQAFLFGVPVEPGDRARAELRPGHGRRALAPLAPEADDAGSTPCTPCPCACAAP